MQAKAGTNDAGKRHGKIKTIRSVVQVTSERWNAREAVEKREGRAKKQPTAVDEAPQITKVKRTGYVPNLSHKMDYGTKLHPD